ncbi:MAG TPA: hypothetical protein VFJ97_07585 [Dermatophilaceae bacterium]|nr:hypothetical protein [Dermatophilaceae bacterium]
MAEPPPVGSVATEAARLVEAVARLARGDSEQPGATAGAHDLPDDSPGSGSGGHEPGRPGQPSGPDEPAGRHTGVCPTCGAPGQEPLTCQLCPLCRGLALLRQVRPETLARLADLAGFVAETLRDLAAERPAGPSTADRGDAATGGRRDATVQRIPVQDAPDPAPPENTAKGPN